MARDVWIARAEYADGSSVEEVFPYAEGGDIRLENQRQYDLECWLIEGHEGCTWYSVDYVADYEEE